MGEEMGTRVWDCCSAFTDGTTNKNLGAVFVVIVFVTSRGGVVVRAKFSHRVDVDN